MGVGFAAKIALSLERVARQLTHPESPASQALIGAQGAIDQVPAVCSEELANRRDALAQGVQTLSAALSRSVMRYTQTAEALRRIDHQEANAKGTDRLTTLQGKYARTKEVQRLLDVLYQDMDVKSVGSLSMNIMLATTQLHMNIRTEREAVTGGRARR